MNAASIQNATLTGGAATVDNHGKGSIMKDVTLTGSTITLTNEGTVENGTYTAETGAMTITNSGKLSSGTYTAKAGTMGITNEGTIENGTYTAETDAMTITNRGKLSSGTYTAKGTMGITNEGTIENGTYTASGDLTYTDTAEASLKGGTLISEEGNVKVTAKGQLALKKLSAHGDAAICAAGDVKIHDAAAGRHLSAEAGGSILAEGKNAKISADTLEIKAGEDIRITDRSPVGKLDGVDTNTPAGSTTGSGAAGSLVTGEAKPHDFDASGKGSALLSSAGGKVTLSAKKVEIDMLKNGEGNAADLKISADNIGIDDLAGVGAQHVTIHGADGQSQAHYAGIHSTSAGGTLVKDSAVEHLHLTGREPLGLSNTAIGGDSLLATDKIRVTIQKNPGSSQAEHFGNLSLSGYDIVTDHVMTNVKDGVTVNGERFPVTAESVMNASLYEDRTLGRDGREKEEETEKDSPSLSFSEPNEKEAYEVVK